MLAEHGSAHGAAQVDSVWADSEQAGKIDKMIDAMSSPTKSDMKNSFFPEALSHSVMSGAHLNVFKKKHNKDVQRKQTSRKRVKQFGSSTAGESQRKFEEKMKKEEEAEQRRLYRDHAKLVRVEKKALYRQGVEV